jgi:hypothetical protein
VATSRKKPVPRVRIANLRQSTRFIETTKLKGLDKAIADFKRAAAALRMRKRRRSHSK